MGVAIIHVVDEASNTSKDFRCDITLLLSHMKLLAADLTDVPGHNIQITVKCDIPTFAWLMAYVKAAGVSGQQQPETTPNNCLQLLLASHYLQMAPVLRSSVSFIAAHLLSLPHSAAAQLCTLEGCLLDKLAKAVQEETLEALYHANCQQQQQQPPQQAQQGSSTAAACSTSPQSHMHDAGGHSSSGRRRSKSATTSSSGSSSACVLVEKLYKHKLRSLLQQGHTTLLCCSVCGELFASASHSKLQCSAAAGSTHTPSNRSQKLPLHQPAPTWELQSYLARQRAAPQQQQQQTGTQPTIAQQQRQHGQVDWIKPGSGLQQQQQLPIKQPPQQQQQEQPHDRAAGRSWRELYWLVWGHVVVLYCQRCCCHFPARLLHHCHYHTLPAVFESIAAPGQYPCCGAQAWQPSRSGGAAASALQGCSSRDHEAYLPAGPAAAEGVGGGLPGRATAGVTAAADAAGRGLSPKRGATGGSASPGGDVGGKGAAQQQGAQGGVTGVDAGRALQLLQLFGPLITTAAPVILQQQQYEQQQQEQPQQGTAPVLPLLVKMVNRGAAAGAAGSRAAESPPAAAGTACCGTAGGGNNSSSRSRPSSVQHLPPISSPRQLMQGEHGDNALPGGGKQRQGQQQQQQREFNLDAAAAAAVAAATRASGGQYSSGMAQQHSGNGRRPMTAGSGDGEDSGGSSSASRADSQDSDAVRSDAQSSRRSRQSSAGQDSEDDISSRRRSSSSSSGDGGSQRASQEGLQGLPLGFEGGGASQAGFEGSDGGFEGDDDLTLSAGAGSTPLSSVMGAVRAAAEARTKGMGAFGSSGAGAAAGGSSSAGLLLQGQRSAPLAETFSAGGKRVLSPLKRKPLGQQGQADPSRPSTAASLLSLNNHQQRWSGLGAQPGAQQQSRPGTGGSSSSMWRQRGSDRAGGSANSAAGGGMVGAAAAGAGVPGLGVGSAINRTLLLELVQQDDAYRMGVLMRRLDSLRLQPPPDGVAAKQQGQLSQVDVMRAVNGAVFQSKYKV